MPTIPAQSAALRLTASNIKSVLIKSNKSIGKLKEDRIRLLDRAAQRKERQEKERAIESPIKGIVPTIGGAFSGLSGMAKPLYDKVIDVFGLLLLGFAVDKLPKIIETLTAAYNKVKPIFTIAINTFKKIAGGFKNLLPVAESIMNFGKGNLNYNSQVKELEGIEKEIDKDLNIFDNLFGTPVEPPEEKEVKEENKDTGLFGSVGNFFKGLFKPKTPEPNKNVKEETGTEKTDLTKLVSENQTLINGLKTKQGQQSGSASSAESDPKAGTGTVTAGSLTGTKEEKWAAVMNMAKKAGAKYPELVAAQFALESAWGTALAGKNNFFGIKAASGESYTLSRTHEVYNGKTVYIDDKFKNFASPQDAINHLVNQWYKNYRGYNGVNNASDKFAAAQMLKKEGYATDPVYANSLSRLMREYSSVRSATVSPNVQTRALSPSGNQSGGTNILILPFGIEKLIPIFQAPTQSEVNSYRNRRNNRNRRVNRIP